MAAVYTHSASDSGGTGSSGHHQTSSSSVAPLAIVKTPPFSTSGPLQPSPSRNGASPAPPSAVGSSTGLPASDSASALTPASTLTPSQSSSALAPTSHHEPISSSDLMALVIELRSRSGRSSSKRGAEASTNAEQALHPGSATSQGLGHSSSSGGASNVLDTLDLCHRKIETLPSDVIGLIKDEVVRLALGYNLISKLAEDFKSMSKLRYLNVRANLITTFPAVLCELPALEILDISRNRIRKLPSEPGRLLNLRVLSISNNRLKKLPTYLSQMKHLRILKLEQNPIQWPPPHVSTLPSHPKSSLVSARDAASDARKAKDEKEAAALAKKRADDRCMMEWIEDLKRWIATNADSASANPDSDKPERAASRSSSRRIKPAAREVPSDDEGDASIILAAPPKAVSAPSGAEMPPEPSEESQLPYDMPSPPARADAKTTAPALQPAPAVKEVSERLPSPPPPPSTMQTMAPVPPMPPQFSPVTTPQMAKEVSGFASNSAILSESPASVSAGHSRNYSHTLGQASPAPEWQQVSSRSAALKNKKSLPDLRESHTTLLAERQASQVPARDEGPSSSTDDSSTTPAPARRGGAGPTGGAGGTRRPPLPSLVTALPGQRDALGDVQRQSPLSSAAALTPRRKMRLPSSESVPDVGHEMSDASNMERSGSGPQAQGSNPNEVNRTGKSGEQQQQQGAGATAQARPAASTMVESERNSYFKRLSTLPAYTISKAVPPAVLSFVDATRGVLYALSQIHTALKQYILFAVDDRISGHFHRVLDIASGSMASLINALDRFDGLSRRGAPEAHVVRGVLIACEASVSMFRKVVSVLALQLGSLQARADPRYTRTLLLLLYGSMGEVRNSWLMMEPHIHAVLPYLAASASSEGGTPHLGAPSLPSIAEATSPGGPRTATQTSAPTNTTPSSGGPRPLFTRPLPRRRQGGSFVAYDVAQGARTLLMSSDSSPQAPSPAPEDISSGTLAGPSRRMIRAGAPAALSGLSLTENSAPLANAYNPVYPSTPGGPASSSGPVPSIPQTATGSFFLPSTTSGGMSGIGVGLPSAPAATNRFTGLRSMTTSPATSTRQLVAQQRRAASNAGGTFLAGMGMGMGIGAGANGSTTAESIDGGNAEGGRRGGHSVGSGPTPSTAGLVPLTPWTAGPMMASAGARPIIDGNLVELLAHVTSVASGTWTALLEHLAAIGVKVQPPPGSGGLLDVEGGTTPNGPSPQPGESGPLQAQQAIAPSPDDSSHGLNASTSAASPMTTPASRKLRELRDLSISTSELTRRLQSTLDKVQEEIEAENEAAGQSIGFAVVSGDARRLLEECSRFVKSVIGVLNLSKALSVEHEWPGPIRLSLSQLTTGARDLTIHLHLLSRN